MKPDQLLYTVWIIPDQLASPVNSVDPDQLAAYQDPHRCELVIINQNMKYRIVLT